MMTAAFTTPWIRSATGETIGCKQDHAPIEQGATLCLNGSHLAIRQQHRMRPGAGRTHGNTLAQPDSSPERYCHNNLNLNAFAQRYTYLYGHPHDHPNTPPQ